MLRRPTKPPLSKQQDTTHHGVIMSKLIFSSSKNELFNRKGEQNPVLYDITDANFTRKNVIIKHNTYVIRCIDENPHFSFFFFNRKYEKKTSSFVLFSNISVKMLLFIIILSILTDLKQIGT